MCGSRWLPGWLSSKESSCNARVTGATEDVGSIPGGGHGNPLQYTYLENPKDGWATVHGVAKSQAQLKRLSIHGSWIAGEG